MKSLVVIGLFGLALSTLACSASTGSSSTDTGISSADRLVLDVRCATDADCPATFECELESEHGASRSFCKSHDTIGSASSPSCPAGTEPELEHGTTFCKAHGGTSSGGGGADDDGGASSSKHTGVDDDGGAASSKGTGVDDDGGAAPTSSGGAPAGAACATSADCATGLECDTSSSTCKAHGGKKI